MGAQHDGRRIKRTIQWNGLRAALDAAADHERASTEEAFTLLVRFGQTPTFGGALEVFASKAERRVVSLLTPPPSAILTPASTSSCPGGLAAEVPHGPPTTASNALKGMKHTAREHVFKEQDQQRRDSLDNTTAIEQGNALSVLLRPSDVAALAAELDALKRVGDAFAAVEMTLGGSASSAEQQRRSISPLHSYATAVRHRGWKDELEAAGNFLATTRLLLGRRGQDILLGERLCQAVTATASIPNASPPISAAELIAEAKMVEATAARQQATAGGTGSGGHPGVVLTARVHLYAPLPDRSARGIRAFHGWGYYGQAAVQQNVGHTPIGLESGFGDDRGKVAGEAVAVLEVFAERGRQTSTTEKHGRTTSSNNMALAASLLSVPALREHPGLVKVHPWARVVSDESGNATGGGGDSAAGGGSFHVVCERLEGWRSLRDVILEHGPLAPPSDLAARDDGGLRVLRLWGKQLAAVLERLGSRSLVLRDLRPSTVFVSPDGSTIKVATFSSLATLSPEGTISREASSLDQSIHGPMKSLTPPEALRRKNATDVSRGDLSASALDTHHVEHSTTLVLADSEQPGAFPATSSWDVWSLGILLFELAFGYPPPPYGASLGCAVASFDETAVANGTPAPELGNLARAVQYDFLSAIDERVNEVETGAECTVTPVVPRLAEALRCMSLGAVIEARDPFLVSTVRRHPAAACTSYELAGEARESVERIRRAWVRRQLQLEERGEIDVMTWQTFQEIISSHLDVSFAAAAPPLSVQPNQETLLMGGDEGGGRTRTVVNDDSGATTSKNRTTGAAAVDRTMVRLRQEDPRGAGWLPFHVAWGVVRDELQLSFSASETEMVGTCLRDGAPGGTGAGHTREKVSQDGDVFYPLLEHVLRASLPPNLDQRTSRVGSASSSPIPAPFVELLCVCLEPDSERRPSPANLLRMSFFSSGDDGSADHHQDEVDIAAAAAFLGGSGNDCSPAVALRQRVERPIQEIENIVFGAISAADTQNGDRRTALPMRSCSAPRSVRGVGGVSGSVDAGVLAEALKELERLVRRTPTHVQVEGIQHARRVARGHAKVIDQVFESEVLVRASALALKLLDQDEVRVSKYADEINKRGRSRDGTRWSHRII